MKRFLWIVAVIVVVGFILFSWVVGFCAWLFKGKAEPF